MHRVVCIKLLFAVDGYSTYAAAGLMLLLAYDYALLLPGTRGLFCCAFSRGAIEQRRRNEIRALISKTLFFKVNVEVIDEIPHQFQRRDLHFYVTLEAGTAVC